MKKFLRLGLPLLLLGLVFLASCGKASQKPLVLMQNKPEIDAALKAYAATWSKASGTAVTIKSVGGGSGADLGTQLKADFAAGDLPDIFVISGLEDYKQWQNSLLDLSDQDWVSKTSVAFVQDGKTYGFPVAIEGWGLAYNADILAKAGVDPATLNSYKGYADAFAKIDSKKKELGINSVVSMAASVGMSWVVGDHDFNAYLSAGLPAGDLSVVNDVRAGKVDATRLAEYADWVELLFKYADKAVLTTGNYDAQVGAFSSGKAAFLHQGNWTDPNMKSANATFKMAFAPYGSTKAAQDGIFISAPSFYVINKDSKNVAAAKKFLSDLVNTPEGNKYIVEEAGSIPAFKNITLSPSGQLSKSVQSYANAGKIYSWNQYYLTDAFRHQTLGTIFDQFASGKIDKAKFISLVTEAVAANKQ